MSESTLTKTTQKLFGPAFFSQILSSLLVAAPMMGKYLPTMAKWLGILVIALNARSLPFLWHCESLLLLLFLFFSLWRGSSGVSARMVIGDVVHLCRATIMDE